MLILWPYPLIKTVCKQNKKKTGSQGNHIFLDHAISVWFPHMQTCCGLRCVGVLFRMNRHPARLIRAVRFGCGCLRLRKQVQFLHQQPAHRLQASVNLAFYLEQHWFPSPSHPLPLFFKFCSLFYPLSYLCPFLSLSSVYAFFFTYCRGSIVFLCVYNLLLPTKLSLWGCFF